MRGEKHEAHGDVVNKKEQGQSRLFACVILLAFTAVLQVTVGISIVQIRNLKLRKEKQLVQNHVTSKWQSWDLNPL